MTDKISIEIVYKTKANAPIKTVQFSSEAQAFRYIFNIQPCIIEAIRIN